MSEKNDFFERSCRIFPSDSQWTKPTVKFKDDEQKTSDHLTKGFDFDEWLNRSEWDLTNDDGSIWRYAYLPALANHVDNEKHQGKRGRVHLFSKASDNKFYIVGVISEISLLDVNEARYAVERFRESGWLKVMANEINEVITQSTKNGLDIESKRYTEEDFPPDNSPIKMFNIKFRPINLDLFVENRKFLFKGTETPAYDKLFNWIPNLVEDTADRDAYNQKLKEYEENNKKIVTSKEYEYHRIQPIIQKSLCDQLNALFSDSAYGVEVKPEDNRVDIKLKINDDITLIEIKCKDCARESIRQSIGQLLEYAHYNQSRETKNFVIVGNNEASLTESSFLELLSDLYKGLYFRYICWPEGLPKVSLDQIDEFRDFFLLKNMTLLNLKHNKDDNALL
ncbi:MAG: hypothetical protein LBS60_06835 [Deltaproteobacteria bacterium]|jgi:hypothetical protein|nr:hypothetical protein [Deltaproteobacteria bacterium]